MVYISKGGSDETGDGSMENPYATIFKGIDSSINGDTVKFMGYYPPNGIASDNIFAIDDVINITKEITITTDNTSIVNEIAIGNSTSDRILFNIQSNNVTISNLLIISLQTAITIYPMSTGNNEPTFWTGITIDNCDFIYTTSYPVMSLSGSFTVSNCNFTHGLNDTIPPNIFIINIYGIRGNCVISNNYLTTWNNSPTYFISLTSQGDGNYFDKCNSKGGTLIVSNNEVYNTSYVDQPPDYFIYINYFNQYNFVTGPDMVYNPNTRLTMNIFNNVMRFLGLTSKFIYIDNKSNSDYATFNLSRIYNNRINTTNYGALHLGKQVDGSLLAIDQIDLDRPVFRLYNNTLVYPPDPVELVYHWDASNGPSMRDIDDNQLQVNGSLNRWIDSMGSVNLLNGNNTYPAILKSEYRNNTIYNYIQTYKGIGGYLESESGIFKLGYTIYLIFNDSMNSLGTGLYSYNYISSDIIRAYGFNRSLQSEVYNSNVINYGDPITGTTKTFNYIIDGTFMNPQVLILQYDHDKWVYPHRPTNSEDVSSDIYQELTVINHLSNSDLLPLKFGYSNPNDRYSNSINLYEIIIYNGLQTFEQVNDKYKELQYKWGIKSHAVKVNNWDSSNGNNIQDINGDPVIVGNPITRWVDSIGNINLVNAGSYPATLETEIRNNVTYNYIKTVSNIGGYIISESGVIKDNYTMYIVFREDTGSHEGNPINVFMNDGTNNMRSYHNNDNYGYINNDSTNDYQVSSYNIRVWAIKVNGDKPYRCIFPSVGSTTFGLFKDLNSTVSIPSLSVLKFGQTEDSFPSSICLYEIIIYDDLQTDNEMMFTYNTLHDKWKVDAPIVPVKVFNYDASVGSSILDENDVPVVIGNPITKWIDNISNTFMLAGGNNSVVLESEVRNSVTYNYIRTVDITNGYLATVFNSISKYCTMYLVFREDNNLRSGLTSSLFDTTRYNKTPNIYSMSAYHYGTDRMGIWFADNIDFQSGSFSSRIWASRFDDVNTNTMLTPINGDIENPTFTTVGHYGGNECLIPRKIYFGKTINETEDVYQSSICMYELRIYDGLHSDSEMLAEYNSLGIKWGIIPPP